MILCFNKLSKKLDELFFFGDSQVNSIKTSFKKIHVNKPLLEFIQMIFVSIHLLSFKTHDDTEVYWLHKNICTCKPSAAVDTGNGPVKMPSSTLSS